MPRVQHVPGGALVTGRRIDRTRLARLRARAQLLDRPEGIRDPADVARSMAGAQAQEKRAGLLQFRSRNRVLTAAEVERARVEERSLTRGWLMRGTVHLVPTDDYRWMLPLFAGPIASESRRRLGQLGVDARAQERALAAVARALEEEGALTRPSIVDRLRRRRIEVTPETRVHLMRVVVAEAIACIGPDDGGSGTLVLSREWLGATEGRGREASLAELARRYLGAFAPATERDFAKWSGLALRDCRAGLERIAAELRHLGDGLVALGEVTLRAPRSPLVRLLPAFDTYLMGYESRRHAASESQERRILPGGGVLRPTVCVDGRFVALWSSKRMGRRLAVAIEPLEEIPDAHLEAIAAEVEDLGRFEGIDASLRVP